MKILVLTYFISGFQVKYYFFDNYIVKEYLYTSDEVKSSMDRAFGLYDLSTDAIYSIPESRDHRFLDSTPLKPAGWLNEHRTIIKTESIRMKYLNYDCLKVTEYINSSSPIGSTTFKVHTYYVDFSPLELNKYMKRRVLLFLGVSEFRYDPFLFKLKIENEFMEENIVVPIFTCEVDYIEMDIVLLEYILNLPVI
jgi:hypothetical protein